MKKLIIGIASGDDVKADFANCLALLYMHFAYVSLRCKFMYKREPEKWVLLGAINEKGPTGHKNRHNLAKKAIELKVDKILFLDADMTYPQNIISELLAADKYIIGCNCTTRSNPTRALAKDFDGKVIVGGNGVEKVKIIPSGCLMVDTVVFKQMEKPYFDMEYIPEKDEWLGLDYYFSLKAQRIGFDCWCHHQISHKIKHIGQEKFSLDMVKDNG